jgi:EAL and modified HD-GYP domain-containing signal transduction protein
MSHPSIPDSASRPLRVNDFYLGRQPIMNRDQALYGYELLFRSAPSGPAIIESDLSATAAVIAHVAQLGLERVIANSPGFVIVDAAVLMSDIFVFLPREQVVLEIVGGTIASAPVLERMAELAGHGFKFALDAACAESDDCKGMLPLIDYVTMDARETATGTVQRIASRFKPEKKLLLAKKVETREQFQTALDAGFDYFQGYYFAKPIVISGRKLSPARLSVVQLMTLVMSDVDNIEIERAVKLDVPLALNLLRLVNTPAVGLRHRIDSLSQAVMILGRRQLQRWLQIMLYAETARQGQSMTPLLMLATTRGRLLELLAKRVRPSQRNVADIAFTVGIMSLMDTLFGMPMEEIMLQIPVSDEVSEALLHRSGFFGDLLRLAECIEHVEEMEDQLAPTLRDLAISSEELVELEMAAFEWSETVVKFAI